MKMKLQVADCRLQVARRNPSARNTFDLRRAFTLIELLVVITILSILVALSVPALKSLNKSNVQVSAGRQLLDDIARARQLAMSQHTTVYMVFVPAIWNWSASFQTPATTNLLDKQFTGYNFLSLRSVGDQPGQGSSQYLAEWKSLPDGMFIATNKFYSDTTIYDNSFTRSVPYAINQFNYTNNLPFPAATNSTGISLPYIAFNYLGQLVVNDTTPWPRSYEYIPLAQGIVTYAANPVTKALQFAAPDVAENPPGNSTNSMFNVIRIDRLTGRAVQLQQKVQ